MIENGYILGFLNKILVYSQEKCAYLSENSFFIKNLDNIIYATILGVFILSTFASSDLIGYVALVTLFLTVIKMFLKKGEKIEMNLFELFLLIYFLAVVVSLAGSSLLYLSFKGFLKTFTYLGFYFSIVQYLKNNKSRIPFIIGTIALCAVSQSFIGIFQSFSQVGEISTWQDVSSINPEDVMTRVYGTLQPFNPNLFGGYMVVTLPCIIGAFILRFINKNYKSAGVFFALSLIASYSLILSGCRGAYLAFALIIACFLGFWARFIWLKGEEKLKKLFVYVSSFLTALMLGVVIFVSSIRTRIFSIFAMRHDSSTSFRFNVYKSSIEMFKDNWLLGIGVGNQNFREIYGLYMKTGFDALSCYNVFLEIGVESGIFALISFVGFLIVLVKKAFNFILKNEDLKQTIIVLSAVSSVLAVMLHGLVDTVFFRPQIQFVFWTMVAVISVTTSQEKLEIK